MQKPHFDKLTHPHQGEQVTFSAKKINSPLHPVIPFIEGDGIGPDIWNATKIVIDAAVERASGGKRKIEWFEIYAGEKANNKYGEWLPNDTLQAIEYYKVAIKGPLTTPVGGGIRSLNVALRQKLDLYACVRPVRYFEGVPSPVVSPEKLDVVIFRENTEDVYAGIEYKQGSDEAQKLIDILNTQFKTCIRKDSGIGIKPMSITGSKRLIRMAIEYALEHNKPSVTMVHKGNIMKFTEGAFKEWGYELAREEFSGKIISEDDVWNQYNGQVPKDKVVLKDRIADAMFQQVLLRPDEYSVLATPNLNGDYLSDACAAQVGGLGLAPGANMGDEIALFEATHGTAPKYAGQDKVNPSSLILSGVMLLEYLRWEEEAKLITEAMQRTISQGKVTYDLERQMEGAQLLSCSGFGKAIVENMQFAKV